MTFTVALYVLLAHFTILIGRTIWPAVVGHSAYNLAWTLSPFKVAAWTS